MKWMREEDILVVCLYFQVGRKAIGENHRDLVELSRFLRRKPSSIAMRSGNVAAIDSENEQKGLSHAGLQTRAVWDEFCGNLPRLNQECKQIRQTKKEIFEQRAEA